MSNQQNILVFGDGVWGSALAMTLSPSNQVYIWSRNQKTQNTIEHFKAHPRLPHIHWPQSIQWCHDENLEHTMKNMHGILIAVPSHAFRFVLSKIQPFIQPKQQIAWGTKGIEAKTNLLMHEIAEQLMPNQSFCILSGPSFAIEVAKKQPTSFMFASKTPESSSYWSACFSQSGFLRCHTSDDVKGVCLLGCLKNTLAIASGICNGLGWGHNAINALISYGICEIQALLIASNCKKETLMSVAGLGDIMLTCLNRHSRNYQFGEQLAKGLSSQNALKIIKETVEGYESTFAIQSLITKNHIKAPVLLAVYQIIKNQLPPEKTFKDLLHFKN